MAGKTKFNAHRPKPSVAAAAVKEIRTGKGGGGNRSNAWRRQVSLEEAVCRAWS
jgi:hypothetical protein